MFQEVVNMIASMAIAVSIVLGAKWVWHRIPHRANRQSDVLCRLSEILVALNRQTEILQTPDLEPGVQRGFLLEIRNSMRDQVGWGKEFPNMMAKVVAPMLERLDQINGHLFADVASRAQIDELIETVHGMINTIISTARPEGVGLVHADVQGVIAKLDEFELSLKNQSEKQHATLLMALDALVLDFGKFQKQQASFMNAMFNGGSIGTVDDEEAARLEKIDALVRRYGISRELAEERVRGSAVYEPSTGRGMRGTV